MYAAIRHKEGGHAHAMDAFLCSKLHCLPSQLEKEDYNKVENLKSFYRHKAQLEEKK